MTALQTRNSSFKIIATMGMVFLMAFLSACDVLATQGARDAIAGGREIREFEDENLRPLQDEMEALWEDEIQPRERELEDLWNEYHNLEQDLLQPLWDAQNDPWAPGGDAAVAQEAFDEQNREYDLMQRQIDLEQHELDVAWQELWSGSAIDPEYQALEDLRNDKQRELDRLYRFGNRPIDDMWDQINELHTSRGFANTDSQIESELINAQLRDLWDQMEQAQDGANNEVNALYERAANVQDELNHLYTFGWDPINEIYSEIDRLRAETGVTTGFDAAGNPITSSTDSIDAQIADLESVRQSYIQSRDNEIAGLQLQLEEIQAATDTTVDIANSSDTERIAELESLLADLEAEEDALTQTKLDDIAFLNDQIAIKKSSYGALIDTAESDFATLSASLLASAEDLKQQIDDLEATGGDDANAQIAILQPQYDALIAQEEAEEAAYHDLVAGYEEERDAGVAEYEAQIVDVEENYVDAIVNDIKVRRAVYEDELESLQTGSTSSGTGSDSTTLTADQIVEKIASTEAHWNGLIEELTVKINALENQKVEGSESGFAEDRIRSLELQAQEAERELNEKIKNLEFLVNDLYNQANNFNSADSTVVAEIQRQIDALNEKLEDIWAQDSANGLEILIQIQTLEKQVRVLEEEREDEQYRLEEELWELDDQLSRFWDDQNSGQRVKEAEYQLIADRLQQRRFELDELRWAFNIEQQDFWDEMNQKQHDANEQIRLIEAEQLGALKEQINAIESELQVFYQQQRDLEDQIRDAEKLVEQKKRELEDKVFDALESAAGTVDEAGDTVLTATEESGAGTDAPGTEEGSEVSPAEVGADGTVN